MIDMTEPKCLWRSHPKSHICRFCTGSVSGHLVSFHRIWKIDGQLLNGGNVCFSQRTPDQVVQVVMASWPTCASFTRESVESFGVGHYSALTMMWFADVGTQPQTNSDVYCVVVQTQSTCWERQCVQPVTAVWRPHRLQPCLVTAVTEAACQSHTLRCDDWFVPRWLSVCDDAWWTRKSMDRWPGTPHWGSVVAAVALRRRSCCCIVSVPAADAKKAEGASEVTRRTPSPPFLTGRLAWSHWRSVRSQLVMAQIACCHRPSIFFQKRVIGAWCASVWVC